MGLVVTSSVWIITLYVIEVTYGAQPSVKSSYIGCYKDEGNPGAFRGYAEKINDLTPQRCTDVCQTKGFLYSATQGRTSCFCDDKHPNPNTKTSEDRCSKPCGGSPTQKCGDDRSLSVYTTGIPDHPEVLNYVGCFDDHIRLLDNVAVNLDVSNSPRRCMNYCLHLGYRYAGVQYGKGCHCGNYDPDRQYLRRASECNWPCSGDPGESCGGNWRMAIYSTNTSGHDSQTSTVVGKYIGCFQEFSFPQKAGFVKKMDDLTLSKCTELCNYKAFLYSWTHANFYCFCGDRRPNPNTKLEEKECSWGCIGSSGVGDNKEKCGGEKAISVRETGIPDHSEIGNYIGCFDDHSRLLNNAFLKFNLTNSPKRCMNVCLQKGYKFAGVQYGEECHCGDIKPQVESAVDGDECNWPCSGDPRGSCGGDWRIAIYSTDTSGTVGNADGIHDSALCIQSDTLVEGKTVCKGDVVFEESFDGPLSDKWKHVVKIPEGPDYEFNLFQSDEKNSHTHDGELVIKPTMFDDTHVLSGTLHLQGCTAAEDSRQCGFTAFSNQILPPVASARINTRDSFSFRYGMVEIRAKMPRGDWLVPELWLEPRDSFYGPGYASGRVRVAMSRGNADLKCGGEDLGVRQLESGVLMGPPGNVQKRTVRIKLPENWNDRYHNYTVIWTPESISFKVDNEKAREIIYPGRRLCEAYDFAQDECLIWSSGSLLAPIDKYFFISLGLSTGNAWDFPDDCVNRGRPKPWRNQELKALLKFWKDRENWHSSWSEDKATLRVDHVRVTAV